MTAKMIFSHHAISRYVQRHAKGASQEEARRILEGAAHTAVKLGIKSANKDADEWELPSLGLRLLVKVDDRQEATEEPQHVVLTILPQRRPQAEDAALIAELQAEARAVFDRVKAERETIREEQKTRAGKPKLTRQSLPALPAVKNRQELSYAVKIAKLELAAMEQWARVLTTETRECEKTARTQTVRYDTHEHTKSCLRVEIRALTAIDDPSAKAALEEIEALHDGFLSPNFWAKL